MACVDTLRLFVLRLLGMAETATVCMASFVYKLNAFALNQFISSVNNIFMDKF